MSINELIETAISEKKIIEFDYHSYHRVAEPHIYGILEGKHDILVFQIEGGSSSGGLPEWRRMHLNEISNLTITDRTFAGPRPNPSGRRSSFDTIITVVS